MARSADTSDTVIDATFGLVAERGWRGLTMRDIASASGITLSALHAGFPTKHHIRKAFLRRIDAAVLAGCDPADAEDPPRDRIFDVVMRRFDALTPYKAAIARMRRDTIRHPAGLICTVPDLMTSMAWMLEAAGLDSDGLKGAVRTKALFGVYMSVFETWLKDDSADMATTMAALDKQLGRVEMAVSSLKRACPRPSDAALQK